jgi:uncharacterized membrane protein
MNLKLGIFICVVTMLVLVVPAAADNNNSKDNNTATVYGQVYSINTFEPLDNAVVSINSTPSQSMVATVGSYSFELAPGNYTISAKYYENGNITYSVTDSVNIINKGTYRHDLLLFPAYSEELMGNSSANGSSSALKLSAENSSTEVSKSNNSISMNSTRNSGFYSPSTSYLLLALISLVLLSAAGYQFFGKQKKKGKTAHKIKDFSISANTHESSLKVSQKSLNSEQMPDSQVQKDVPVSVTEQVTETGSKTSVTESAMDPEFMSLEGDEEEESEENLSTQKKELVEPGSTVETLETSLEKSEVNPEIDIQDTKKKLPLPSDLQEVMDIIRGQRGRITQKELCGRLKCSDAKVSLMLADLERRNLIEKFKKGRGNVVVLKDEEQQH